MNRIAFGLYGLGWRVALPLLHKNSRMAEGFKERILGPLTAVPPIDLWIQAASAGEAFLALSIQSGLTNLQKLTRNNDFHILITTNTRQGFDILQAGLPDKRHPLAKIFISYFPFDEPKRMETVVQRLSPRLTVLLETEIWPGLLLALKQRDLPAIIVNGRLSPKSLGRYLLLPAFFRTVAPEEIMAMSKADATRFNTLFPTTSVTTMPNIKFDRISFADADKLSEYPLNDIFGDSPDLVVLGSVREEEEPWIEKIILYLFNQLPKIRIALFPRHMHRLDAWQAILKRMGHSWCLRSSIAQPVAKGTTILWDTFGELSQAYSLARAVFVGGSLAPLGGQNFLEPLAFGVCPVIGPSWNNFFWIGEGIFSQKLVRRCSDWHSVAIALLETFQSASDPEQIRARARSYIQRRQGGTLKACALIEEKLLERMD